MTESHPSPGRVQAGPGRGQESSGQPRPGAQAATTGQSGPVSLETQQTVVVVVGFLGT